MPSKHRSYRQTNAPSLTNHPKQSHAKSTSRRDDATTTRKHRSQDQTLGEQQFTK